MLGLFGTPGANGRVTSPRLAPRIVREDVGPFTVEGLDVAVESLKLVLAEAKIHRPDLVEQLKMDGMLVVRRKRGNSGEWSNHAFGIAIDLFYGDGVTPQGVPKTQRGLLDLYFYFHKHGWYWGAGYRGAAVDSMHFELSEQFLRGEL